MKRRLNILFSSLLVFSSIVKAQVITFSNVYGGYGDDFGYSVVQTNDRGYVVAGASSSIGNGSSDAYLMKTDSLGNVEWQKTFGGTNVDQGYSVQITRDSGLIVAGFTNSLGMGGYDMYVVKTDSIGDTLWTKTYGGDNWDFAYSIAETKDSCYVIAGGTYSFGNGSEDVLLIKINAIGDTLWTKTYGGDKEDVARSVKQTMDGGFILTGSTKSFGDDNGDIYTIRTNSNGDTLWTNVYGLSKEDIGMEVVERPSGEIVVVGKAEKSSGFGNSDGIRLGINSNGSFSYEIFYGGSDNDALHGITDLVGGYRYAVTGYTYSYGWQQGASDVSLYIENPFAGFIGPTFGGTNMDKGYSIKNTSDSGYIVCGNSNSFSGSNQIYLIKTDSSGSAPPTPNITITDITENKNAPGNITIYPNPANDYVYINLQQKNIVTIRIIDFIGRTVISQKINPNEKSLVEISTSELSSGVYFVQVEDEENFSTRKLIIQ